MAGATFAAAGREGEPALEREMLEIGKTARIAARRLALASTESKNGALLTMAAMLSNFERQILEANAFDVEAAKEAGRPGSFIDRLTLNPSRIQGMADGLETIAALPDPVG